MVVVQRPRAREFCATMLDYIIDTDVTITFAVEYGGRRILDEEYVPDARNQVRIRKLGKFCELALWGVWIAGDPTPQNDASGTFTFYINEVKDSSSLVMYSRLQTRKDSALPGILSEVNHKVTRPGCIEYLSGFPTTGNYTIDATLSDGTRKTATIAVGTTSNDVAFTVDVSVDKIARTQKWANIIQYRITMGDASMLYDVNATPVPHQWLFRFKNVYDMPETMTCVGPMKLNGSNNCDNGQFYGVERKFHVAIDDEYTIASGPIFLQSDYKLWHNLLNAQEVCVYSEGAWLPVVITKQKFEREMHSCRLSSVEFSFRMADADQNNMIEI